MVKEAIWQSFEQQSGTQDLVPLVNTQPGQIVIQEVQLSPLEFALEPKQGRCSWFEPC